MNQRIHVTLHRFTIGQHDFRRISLDRSRLQTRKCLHRDLVRLLHLAHAHHVARPNITVRLSRHFKIVLLITAVRVRATNIEIDTATAQTRSGKSPVDRVFSGDAADALRASLKNLVAAKQRMKLVERSWKVIEKLFAAILETRRQIHHQTADAEVRRRQSSTWRSLDHVQDLFALAETVKENGHRADIERVCAEPDEM